MYATAQQQVVGVGTSVGPALAWACTPYFRPDFAACGLHMAWKGVEGDPCIYWSTFDGNGWAPQQQVPGVGTSFRPALADIQMATYPGEGAVGHYRLFMAWKGVEGDEGIYWSTFDGKNWAPQQQVPGVGTSIGPALALRGSAFFMAWKGVEGDPCIYWSTFDANGWAPQQQVPGVGTSIGPALAEWNGVVYMAWKGVEGDEGIYWSTFDGNNWAPQQLVEGVGTSIGPALCVGDTETEASSALYMAWKGVEGDPGIYWTRLDDPNGQWTPQRHVDGVGTSIGPALGDWRPVAAWKGVDGDQGIYWSE